MYGFHIEGHADYAEHGRDIVCSAVSAIAQSTELSLRRHARIESDMRPGDMSVFIEFPNVLTNVLMDAMVRGLTAIASQYPEYVTIQEENHDKETRI